MYPEAMTSACSQPKTLLIRHRTFLFWELGYSYGASRFGPATFPVLDSLVCLVVTVPSSVALGLRGDSPPSPPAVKTEGSVSLQALLLTGGRCQPGAGKGGPLPWVLCPSPRLLISSRERKMPCPRVLP